MIWFANFLLNTVFAASTLSYVLYSPTLDIGKIPNPDNVIVLDESDCHVLGIYHLIGGTSTPETLEFYPIKEAISQPCIQPVLVF